MARIPQPRELAELKGATRHDPQRYRKQPAKSTRPLGDPPESFMGEELKAWMELEECAAAGVLTGAERPIMEMTCKLIAEMRVRFETMPTSRIQALISCLARLGLTPADRQKVGVEGNKVEENPFETFQ